MQEHGRPLAYRPNEAARLLGVGRDTVFDLLRTGELRGFKLGHRMRLISAEELERFVREREAAV